MQYSEQPFVNGDVIPYDRDTTDPCAFEVAHLGHVLGVDEEPDLFCREFYLITSFPKCHAFEA